MPEVPRWRTILPSNFDFDTMSTSETDSDDLTRRIAEAITPIIRDYVDERVGDTPGDGSGITEDDVIALIKKHAPAGGDGLTEADVIDLIAAHAGSGDGKGGLTEAEVIALINEHASGGTGGDPERLDALITRAEYALSKLELATGLRGTKLSVGPTEPTEDDAQHTNPLWGVHFQTDHSIHLGRATIDSLASGEFTIVCYRYEAGELREVAGEQTIRANGHEQRVPLEMTLDPGEYLLTRPVPGTRNDVGDARGDLPDIAFYPDDEAVSLRRRADYDGWEDDSQHGLTWYGGDNPSFAANKFWYYFFDLEVTVDPPEAHAEEATTKKDAGTDDYEPPEVDISRSEP